MPRTDPSASRVRRAPPLLAGAVAGLSVVACEPSGPPTYAGEVATVLHESCASCHRPGGPAPFVLLDYEDARRHAAAIAASVRAGRMPPWLPVHDATTPAFEGDRRLTDRERETLLAWAEAGAPAGDLSGAPEPPRWPDGWALGEPDVVLEMSDTFAVPGTGGDLFRNFVLPLPVRETRWVEAVELRPSNTRVVHHATMRVDASSASRLAARRDSVPGFDEMFSRTGARPPGGFFLGWTPGRVPRPNPEGMAWPAEPGMDFVVQLHLRPTGDQERVAVQVGLHFADRPPSEHPLIVRLGGQTMDIPAGDSAYAVEDEFVLPVDVSAYGVYPHAHYVARRMDVWAELPDGGRVTLIRIPEWNFNWQDAYRYDEPVPLPAGTRLRMRYVYDNSAANPLNPSDPPRRVVYGPASADEMAELWLQVVPDDPDDLRRLEVATAEKAAEDQLEGYRHLVALDSTDAEAQLGLGNVARERGDLAEARRRYRLALAAQPDFAGALYNLGLVEEALERPEEALEAYRRAVEALPDHADAWNNMGRLLGLGGHHAGAADAFRRALAVDSTLAPAHFNLATTLVEMGRAEEGLQHLNRGLALDGSNVQAALSVTWTLATHPDDRVRRPDLAAGLAEQIRAAAGPHPTVLEAEAAAHAAAGRFDLAVARAERALQLARGRGETEQAAEIAGRLALYRSGRPFVANR